MYGADSTLTSHHLRKLYHIPWSTPSFLGKPFLTSQSNNIFLTKLGRNFVSVIIISFIFVVLCIFRIEIYHGITQNETLVSRRHKPSYIIAGIPIQESKQYLKMKLSSKYSQGYSNFQFQHLKELHSTNSMCLKTKLTELEVLFIPVYSLIMPELNKCIYISWVAIQVLPVCMKFLYGKKMLHMIVFFNLFIFYVNLGCFS